MALGSGLSRIQDLDQQLDELERELKMRRRMYPRWVADGKMAQATADRQIRLMEGAKETVRLARVDAMMRGPSGQRISDS